MIGLRSYRRVTNDDLNENETQYSTLLTRGKSWKAVACALVASPIQGAVKS